VAVVNGRTRADTTFSKREAPRVLIVMNETLGNLVAVTLRHGPYETERSTNAQEPFIDIVGRGLTRGQMPILAFTRRRDTALKLSAYERGADDIIEVPFTLDEIVARPFALMRRAHGIPVTIVPKIKLDGLEVDLLSQRVSVGGRELQLTPIQQTLLYLLAANAGRALSREDLLSSIWGSEFEIESNVVDRHIRELRVKLDDEWRAPRFIETVPGAGYRFKAQEPVGDAAK